MRALLALLLGLVLQVALAAPGVACVPERTDVPAPACGAMSGCACCAKKVSCDCAADSKDEKKPLPPASMPERPVTVLLALAPAATDLGTVDDFPTGAVGFRGPDARHAGFPGVALAVAFCRWII